MQIIPINTNAFSNKQHEFAFQRNHSLIWGAEVLFNKVLAGAASSLALSVDLTITHT